MRRLCHPTGKWCRRSGGPGPRRRASAAAGRDVRRSGGRPGPGWSCDLDSGVEAVEGEVARGAEVFGGNGEVTPQVVDDPTFLAPWMGVAMGVDLTPGFGRELEAGRVVDLLQGAYFVRHVAVEVHVDGAV